MRPAPGRAARPSPLPPAGFGPASPAGVLAAAASPLQRWHVSIIFFFFFPFTIRPPQPSPPVPPEPPAVPAREEIGSERGAGILPQLTEPRQAQAALLPATSLGTGGPGAAGGCRRLAALPQHRAPQPPLRLRCQKPNGGEEKGKTAARGAGFAVGDPLGAPSLPTASWAMSLSLGTGCGSLATVPGGAALSVPARAPSPAARAHPEDGKRRRSLAGRCCMASTAPADTPLTQHPSAAQGGPGNWEEESGGGTSGDGCVVLGCPPATSASCSTASPPCAEILTLAVQSCHGSVLASRWCCSHPASLAFLPQIPSLGGFWKGETGAWLEHPLQPRCSQC